MLVHLGQFQKYKETRKLFLPKHYCSHDGTCKFCKELCKWYRFGAEQDSVEHQVGLAICYLFGIGVPKHSIEAAAWFGRAAAAGHEFAIRSLEALFKKLEAICKLDSILECAEIEEGVVEEETSDPI